MISRPNLILHRYYMGEIISSTRHGGGEMSGTSYLQVPAGHLVPSAPVPLGQYWPSGHSSGVEQPSRQIDPAGHSVHSHAPGDPEYFPKIS